MAVYFIQNHVNKAIKIGVSRNPERRLHSLRTASSDRLSLLGSIAGGIELEAELHRRFADHRLRGEWFRGDPPVIEAIRCFLDGSPAAVGGPSVWQECLWRSKCRHGLKGLEVLVPADGRESLIHHTLWDADSRLILVLEDGDRLSADQCVLLDEWPVTCCQPSPNRGTQKRPRRGDFWHEANLAFGEPDRRRFNRWRSRVTSALFALADSLEVLGIGPWSEENFDAAAYAKLRSLMEVLNEAPDRMEG